MKKLLILFSMLWLISCSDDDNTNTAVIEPVSEDVLIDTPEEMAAFTAQNITHLKGSLTLNGTNLGTDELAGLESLEQIDGTLLIKHCHRLIKLTGLKNLRQAGSIILETNASLKSLDGFAGLETVTDEFRLYNNNELKNLHGLENLTSVRYLNISSQAVTSIAALQSLTTAENITINANIPNLQGLNNLTSVKTLNLWVYESLDGLDNLVSAGTINIIGGNMQNLHGLESLTSVGTLIITDNDITSLDGLQNLQKADNIIITDNRRLTSLAALQSLTAVGNNVQDGGIYIWDNGLVSLDGLEHITTFKGSIVMEEDLTNFCPLQNILSTGDLGMVSIQRYGLPVPTSQDIINGNCTVD